MRHLCLTLCIICLNSLPIAWGCVNGYEAELASLLSNPDPKENALKVLAFETAYYANPNQVNSNDLAVSYLYTGKYQKAIDILLDLEKRIPNLGFTASNLGTAYELIGDNVQALRWIKEGIARNPKDHDGTEWLHIKILEAKLSIAKDPKWLDHNTVLGVDFGPWNYPNLPLKGVIDFNGHMHNVNSMAFAIETQLKERVKFVQPPDLIVSDLFASLYYLQTLGVSLRSFHYPYEFAHKYSSKNDTILKTRFQFHNHSGDLAAVSLILFLFIMIFLLLKGVVRRVHQRVKRS